MQRAVFLDRDGTVSEEVGYINHLDRFRLYPWTSAAILRLNQADVRVVLVTNQAGVARGLFTEDLLQEVHAKLERELEVAGASLDAIYYCPHHPEARIELYRQDCDCRKPKVGMLLRAARELNLDLASSFVVGDTYRDVEMGFRAGTRTILVLSGYGRGEYVYQKDTWIRQPDFVASDLSEAIEWILSECGTD